MRNLWERILAKATEQDRALQGLLSQVPNKLRKRIPKNVSQEEAILWIGIAAMLLLAAYYHGLSGPFADHTNDRNTALFGAALYYGAVRCLRLKG